MSNTDEFAEIRELAEKATPVDDSTVIWRYELGGGRMSTSDAHLILDCYHEADREFYFACRTEVPRLLAAVDALKAELAKHQESEFHPDWSLLDATRASLRENCAEAKKQLAAKDAEIERLKAWANCVAHFLYWSGYLDGNVVRVAAEREDGSFFEMGWKNLEQLKQALDEQFPDWRTWNPNYAEATDE